MSTTVDANGYWLQDPFVSQVLTLTRAPGIPAISATTSANAGHVYTIFSAGTPTGSASFPPQVEPHFVVCDDTVPPSGHLSSCTTL